MNILDEVQRYVADRLNERLGACCRFVPENAKTVDYEIKKHLGEQGVVGLVLTPKAQYAGAFEDVGIAWEIPELEVDVVENPTVNRGRPLSSAMTGQDVAMEVFNWLCPLSGEGEGVFCPVSYEEGEDGSLLVNRCVLKCLVHPDIPKSKYTYAVLDGGLLSALYEGAFTYEMFKAFAPSSYTNITDLSVGTGIGSLSAFCLQYGSKLSSVVLPDTITDIGDGSFYMSRGLKDVQMKEGISAIGQDCFFDCRALRVLEIPSTVQAIGRMAFKVTNDQYLPELSSITFKGKKLVQVQSMENYPWGIRNTSIIHGGLDVPTQVEYVGGSSWEGNIVGPLTGALGTPTTQIPNIANAEDISLGTCVTSISSYAFWNCASMKSIEIPDSVSSIGTGAFTGCTGLSSIDVPEGVAEIGYRAMYNCRYVKDVSVPSSVSSIGSDAFLDCYSLENVMFKGKTPAQVQAMANYPWGVRDTSIIHAELVPAYYVDWTVQNGSTSADFGNYRAGDEIVFAADEGYRYVQWRLNDGDEYTGEVYDGIWTYAVQGIEAPQRLRITFNMYEP